ncbi:MAG: molybdopterin molybdotransferase MoeA [Brevinema sp.]
MSLLPQDGLQLINSYPISFLPESIPLSEALLRVLPSEILASFPQPPFNKSAMDGFAYHTENFEFDPQKVYSIHPKTLSAGEVFTETLSSDQCIRIMTGAPVPTCFNAVQRVEYTKEDKENNTVVFTKAESSKNIIKKGQNQELGSVLLTPRVLRAVDIALLAAEGIDPVTVIKKPKIAIISTGDELQAPNQDLREGGIYDSNSYMLAGLIKEAGFEGLSFGIVKDNKNALRAVCEKAFAECDLLLFSGGVSKGDFDFVPEILKEFGVEQIVHSLRIKPGKPLFFGKRQSQAVFGLPGNPVSAFVCFHIFVKSYLLKCMGLDYTPKELSIPISKNHTRKEVEREEYIPARLISENGVLMADPLPYSGSSMLSVLSKTELLIKIEIDKKNINKGDLVHARFISERN